MVKTNSRVEGWKRKLLDLSKRNRMLNYKPLRVGSLEVERDLAEIKKMIFEDEAIIYSISTYLKKTGQSDPEYEKEKQETEDDARRLRKIKKTIKTASDELGYNIGYLAIDFLEWTESETSDVTMKSPILLVPITIEQESVLSPFHIKFSNSDEIKINPVLIEVLRREYNIDIEEKINTIDFLSEDVFTKVRNIFEEIILSQEKWSINNEMYLDTFKFQNMTIINDLEINNDLVEQNLFSSALIENKGVDAEWDEEVDLDKHPSKDSVQILDADSSQQEAIERASRGESFVIQGPPGTGKSQTITNIIAEAMYAGKRVLFVSEKQAALDVVFEKLRRAKLSEFCLKMHSQKQAKTAIRDQLQQTIDLTEDNIRVDESEYETYAKIDHCIAQLNNYTNLIHKKIPVVGKTPYYIFGKYQQVQDVVGLNDLKIGVMPYEKADQIFDLVGEFASLLDEYSSDLSNSSLFSFKKDFSSENFRSVKKKNADAIAKISELENKITNFKKLFKNIDNFDWEDIDSFIIKISNKTKQNTSIEKLVFDKHYYLANHGERTIYAKHLREIKNFATETNKLIEENTDLIKKNEDLIKKLKSASSNGKLPNLEELENNENKINIDFKNPIKRLNNSYKEFKKTLSEKYIDISLDLHHKEISKKITSLIKKIKESNQYSIDIKTNYKKINQKLNKLNESVEEISEYKKYYNLLESFCKPKKDSLIDINGIKNIITSVEWVEDLLDSLDNARFTLDDMQRLNLCQFCDTKSAQILDEYDSIIKIAAEIKEIYLDLSDYIAFDDINNKHSVYLALSLKENLDNIDWNIAPKLAKRNEIVNELSQLTNFKIIDTIENAKIPKKMIVPIIKKQYYTECLEASECEDEFFHNGRTIHDGIVNNFKEYDKRQQKIAQLRIRQKLIDSVPKITSFIGSYSNNGNSELSFLKRELQKKKRLVPTRILLQKIPTILQQIKPCIMMSPITVSSYFADNKNLQFDMVIFDEASQVKPEYAITSIMRAKQLIIAGDSKQMPPTSFFEASSEEDEYDENAEENGTVEDLESILDELSASLPEVKLRWHYRSKDESLISFSNKKFYEKKLYTFPSVYLNNDNLGVKFEYVENGVWENRNGNTKEAERVAKLVFESFKKHPDESIGVVAFGVNQETAIEEAIDKMRNMNPDFEDFFSSERDEPFFVKNLENVQGDERDHIILSVGYGKAPDGSFAMRFGPLMLAGGERRLNVAISRSKSRMTVVCSFHSNQIRIDNEKQINRKLLKEFIEFAERPNVDLIIGENDQSDDPSSEFDSPFEEGVFHFIESLGYKCVPQVGSSGYKIDIAIINPKNDSRYLMAIECDGASYHSSRTARDRDRLRQENLERQGWIFHRIWSTDWFYNNKIEKERLKQAIIDTLSKYEADESNNKNIAPQIHPKRENIEDDIKTTHVDSLKKEREIFEKFLSLRRKCPGYWYGNTHDYHEEEYKKAIELAIKEQIAYGISVHELCKIISSYFVGNSRMTKDQERKIRSCILSSSKTGLFKISKDETIQKQ